MRITVDAQALAKELDYLGRVIDKKLSGSIAAIGTVLLEAKGKTLTLAATDLDVSSRSSIAAEVATAGKALVSAEEIRRLTQTLTGELSLAATKERWLELACGGAKAKLPGLDPEDFPLLPEPPKKGGVELPGDALALAIRRTIFIPRREVGKQAGFFCVQLVAGDGKIAASATDGHRLAHAVVDAPEAKQKEPLRALVPLKAAQLFVDLQGRIDGGVTFSVDERHLFFRVGDTLLSSKLPADVSFPKPERVLGVPEKHAHVEVEREALAMGLKRLGVVANGQGVRFDVSLGKLKILAESPDKGQIEDELLATLYEEKDPRDVTFGIDYLTDYLATVDGDKLTMALGGREDHVHMWPTGSAETQHYVVAPRWK